MTPHGWDAGCRCGTCTRVHQSAKKIRQRENRMARRVEVDGILIAPLPPDRHGKHSTYCNWGCRCEPCVEANTVYWRDRYGYQPRAQKAEVA